MNLSLEGKVALCSASSKGMGFACAKAFLDSGARVVVLSRDDNNVQNALKNLGNSESVLGLTCDVSKKSEIDKAFDQVIGRFGRVDVLLNNAGGPKPGKLGDLTDNDWFNAFELNFMSTVRLTEKVVPYMKKNNFGRIINITSILAKSPSEGMVLSNSMRAAVLAFGKTMSRELGPFGITVNSLCPGAIATDRFKNLVKLDAEEEKISENQVIKNIEKNIPVNFIGQPDDFASMVMYLASPQARYVNGTVIQVDGGEYKGLL